MIAGVVGLLLLVGITFVTVAFTANRLLRPAVPGGDKTVTYECGVDPVGEGWAQSHIRYYVFAYLYVVFAVDALYLFPWATVFAAPLPLPREVPPVATAGSRATAAGRGRSVASARSWRKNAARFKQLDALARRIGRGHAGKDPADPDDQSR